MRYIDKLLKEMVERGASDLHIQAGLSPKFRINGEIVDSGHPPMDNWECERFLYEILTEEQLRHFIEYNDLDFAYGDSGIGRFRCNYFRQYNGIGAAFRRLSPHIPTIEELNLPKVIEKFAHYKDGLVLITGASGTGKSTTLAAIINIINNSYRKHIVTLEDPIEYVFENNKSVIHQRGLGYDILSFEEGIKDSLREDVDVLVVGEMRDYETIRLVLSAAETGTLVYATLHTQSVAKTIDRIIDVFPVGEQSQARVILSQSLRAILSQVLIKRKDGEGRLPACEILFSSPALSRIILDGRIHEIPLLLQTGKAKGMISMDEAIESLLKKELIDPQDAYALIKSRKEFKSGF